MREWEIHVAGPSRTIADLVKQRFELKVFCTNEACERVKLDGTAPNGLVLDATKLDPEMRDDELALRLKCSLCGKPGKLQKKAPPFNYGADSGFSSASSGPRESTSIPTPPDRPDTPEMKWHGKTRSRRRRR